MNRKEPGFLMIVLILIVVPLMALGGGVIYSYPAIKLTKGREPWLSLLLAVGLGISIVSIGASGRLPWITIGGLWLGSIALLMLARRLYGSLSRNLEDFGVVHLFVLLAVMAAVTWHVGAERRRGPEGRSQRPVISSQ
jgi:hypothetical protein